MQDQLNIALIQSDLVWENPKQNRKNFSEKIKKNPNICVQILRSDLASIAGIATETFIRTLSDFKKEGLIDVDERNIKILNIKKLKRIN